MLDVEETYLNNDSKKIFFNLKWQNIFKRLSDEDLAQLVRAIYAYAIDSELPNFSDNRILGIAFAAIIQQIEEESTVNSFN